MVHSRLTINKNWFQKNLGLGVVVLIIIYTLACLFLAKPLMPKFGLDPSWALGMNWAIANGLRIGEDIVFTFGPYASSYTRAYDPTTDYLMVGAALFLTLCYGLQFLYLAGRHRLYVAIFLTAAIIAFPYSNDALFLLYPLLTAFCVRKYAISQKPSSNEKQWGGLLLMGLLSAPLGFLPLVKGSFALSCTVTGFAIVCYLVYSRRKLEALTVTLIPVATVVLAWVLAGQQLMGIPSYFISMSPIISGYTEGMALGYEGAAALKLPAAEILTYILIAMAILALLVKNLRHGAGDKLFCLVVGALFVFIVFKAGFTRHDGHAIIAACGLLFFAVATGFILQARGWVACLLMAFVGFFIIGNHHQKKMLQEVSSNIKNTYSDGWQGISARLDPAGPLKIEFSAAFKEMKSKQSLPLLSGSSDIYSYDQAALLASGNQWNPRPIFQSYSAYTKNLAELNALHLRNKNAPENIFFKPQTIDGRFVPLEDGASWPALLDNYDVVGLIDDTTIMRKREILLPVSTWVNKTDRNFNVAEDIKLPSAGFPVYVTLQVRPTFLGRILTVLFKPPPLNLELTFNNGRKENYRVISGMMESGFFISPRVITGKEFYLMQSGNARYISSSTVASFKLTRPSGGSLFWQNTVQATIAEYQNRPPQTIGQDFFSGAFEENIAAPVAKISETCDGAIDVINEVAVSDAPISGGGFFSVNGWLAESGKDGTVPEKVFVSLIGDDGRAWYAVPLSTPRADVKSYLGHPEMPDLGFSLAADISKLSGHYSVGLLKLRQGKAIMCQFKKSLMITHQ